MPQPSGAVSDAPPVNRDPRWIRAGALALTALIFVADALTPAGLAVPTFYVAPILLFMKGGEYWEPLLVGAAATVLIAAGVYVTPDGGSAEIGAINRPLEMLTVWISAGAVAHYRRTLARWAEQSATDRIAREQSLRSPRRDALRARPGGDRRGHRPARHHHLRQRQVLRDLRSTRATS